MLIGTDKKVWVFDQAVDMRNGYQGLYGLCRQAQFDVLKGDLFLFISRDRKQAKVLFWDGSGLRILMKKMESQLFAKIYDRGEMTVSELELFMEGAKMLEKICLPEREKYTM